MAKQQRHCALCMCGVCAYVFLFFFFFRFRNSMTLYCQHIRVRVAPHRRWAVRMSAAPIRTKPHTLNHQRHSPIHWKPQTIFSIPTIIPSAVQTHCHAIRTHTIHSSANWTMSMNICIAPLTPTIITITAIIIITLTMVMDISIITAMVATVSMALIIPSMIIMACRRHHRHRRRIITVLTMVISWLATTNTIWVNRMNRFTAAFGQLSLKMAMISHIKRLTAVSYAAFIRQVKGTQSATR